MEDFSGLWYDCENFDTNSSEEQCSCEQECAKFMKPLYCYSAETLIKLQNGGLANENNDIRLLRSLHVNYLLSCLEKLPGGYVSLDSSRPWICYWIIHALYLLDREPSHLYDRVISTLHHIQNCTGGFGGGPNQLSQGAPNYAAVLTLCTIGTDAALAVIDRPAMYNFFLRMKQPSGGFSIHLDGEVDSRGSYTIIAIAKLLNILTDELAAGAADFMVSCQTYEGGFGGEYSNEAHGGYNFCTLASLLILGEVGKCDITAQERWLLHRQMKLEGGFQGRTNKLVDACYSFWQGSALALVEIVRHGGSDTFDLEQYKKLKNPQEKKTLESNAGESEIELTPGQRVKKVDDTSGVLPFNQKALQRYILHCAQNLESGGLRDKPGKSRDFYHSCYALSGLSVAQSCMAAPNPETLEINPAVKVSAGVGGEKGDSSESSILENLLEELPETEENWQAAQVFGDFGNLLNPTSAVYNIGLDKLDRALNYFKGLPSTHQELVQAYEARSS